YRVARAPAFGEANKRTALLLARWVLDRNGEDGLPLLPPTDRELSDLLVKAASGMDVERQMIALLLARGKKWRHLLPRMEPSSHLECSDVLAFPGVGTSAEMETKGVVAASSRSVAIRYGTRLRRMRLGHGGCRLPGRR